MFFQTLKRFLTSFSILFNFQGPVRFSLAADDLFIVPPKWFFVKPYFLEAFKLSELGALQASQCQLVFSASIGSFHRLPAEALEVILLPQRLALKYNTTPPSPCHLFLTDFFIFFLALLKNVHFLVFNVLFLRKKPCGCATVFQLCDHAHGLSLQYLFLFSGHAIWHPAVCGIPSSFPDQCCSQKHRQP